MGRKSKKLNIKESLETLYRLKAKISNTLLTKRLEMLIECKKRENTGVSKEELCRLVGCCGQSVVDWRRMYEEGGIDRLMSHNRKSNHKPILSAEEQEKVKQKLSDANNPCIGYVELVEWVKKELGVEIKYITLYTFVKNKFGTKIKKARKSHIKKDEQAGEDFKKKVPRKV